MFGTSRATYYYDPKEILSGRVGKDKASDIEERSAIALSKLQIPFSFRVRFNPLVPGGFTMRRQNVIGEAELDFWTEYQSKIYAFQIQGEIAHFYYAAQMEIDRQKRIKLNNALKAYNAHPIIDVPFWLLTSQDAADRLFRNGFASGWNVQLYPDGGILSLPTQEVSVENMTREQKIAYYKENRDAYSTVSG